MAGLFPIPRPVPTPATGWSSARRSTRPHPEFRRVRRNVDGQVFFFLGIIVVKVMAAATIPPASAGPAAKPYPTKPGPEKPLVGPKAGTPGGKTVDAARPPGIVRRRDFDRRVP